MSEPKQFDWEAEWGRVRPLTLDRYVDAWLVMGMMSHSPKWEPKDGPHSIGRGAINGRPTPAKGTLEWYQPSGRCHWIAPFSWAVGRKLYPSLRWGFYTAEYHTVAVGCTPGTEAVEVVMDILLFKNHTGQGSLDWVGKHPAIIRDKLPGARFAWNPLKMLGRADADYGPVYQHLPPFMTEGMER